MNDDARDLPQFRVPRLSACPKCGSAVDVQYICGLGAALRAEFDLDEPFADTVPSWYVLCGKCGNNLVVRAKAASFDGLQKALTKLGRAWNAQWKAEPVVERLVFVREKKESREDNTGES